MKSLLTKPTLHMAVIALLSVGWNVTDYIGVGKTQFERFDIVMAFLFAWVIDWMSRDKEVTDETQT